MTKRREVKLNVIPQARKKALGMRLDYTGDSRGEEDAVRHNRAFTK